MIVRNILFAGMAVIGGTANAQEIVDSLESGVAYELDEIVIEAQNQRTSVKGLIATPDSDVKRASVNGVDLLARLGLPSLRVDVNTGTVSTVTGKEVSLFINYLPVGQGEVEGMNMADVISVQYLEFPQDARFMGAKYVVNYIMKVQSWGGYTKVGLRQSILAGSATSANIYSKFSKDKVSMDFYVGSDFTSFSHTGEALRSSYDLSANGGGEVFITRELNPISSQFKKLTLPFSFRLTYSGNHIISINTADFTYSGMPRRATDGALRLSTIPELLAYRECEADYSRTYGLTSLNIVNFSEFWKMIVRVGGQYSHNNNSYYYNAGDAVVNTIANISREDVAGANFTAMLKRVLRANSSVGLLYGVDYRWNKVDYIASATAPGSFNNLAMSANLSYDLQTDRMSIYCRGGVEWNKSSVGGETVSQVSPNLGVGWSYILRDMHRLAVDAWYSLSSPLIMYKSSDVIRSTEYLYLTGNPQLNSWHTLVAEIGYTVTPSNKFSASLTGEYRRDINTAAVKYDLYEYGEGLLRTFANSGYYQTIYGGIQATYQPVKSLQLQGSVGFMHQRQSGLASGLLNAVPWSLSARYYAGAFNFSAGYKSVDKDFINIFAENISTPSSYSVSAGWSNGSWNVALTLSNFMRSSWKESEISSSVPRYSEYRDVFGRDCHRALTISVTYVIGYGKSVQTGDEVGAGQRTQSAILK